jgi:hypothetical protein
VQRASHPATSLLDELTRALPLVACVLLDGAGTVRATSSGAGEGVEGGVACAAVDALLEAAQGLLRTIGEPKVEGFMVEGTATHAYARIFGEGVLVAFFDPTQTTYGAVRVGLRRQSEALALLVQVEAPSEPVDRRAVRRFLARL